MGKPFAQINIPDPPHVGFTSGQCAALDQPVYQAKKYPEEVAKKPVLPKKTINYLQAAALIFQQKDKQLFSIYFLP